MKDIVIPTFDFEREDEASRSRTFEKETRGNLSEGVLMVGGGEVRGFSALDVMRYKEPTPILLPLLPSRPVTTIDVLAETIPIAHVEYVVSTKKRMKTQRKLDLASRSRTRKRKIELNRRRTNTVK